MAVSFDDKMLGEKAHYYCSSSEDEADDSDKEELEDGVSVEPEPAPLPVPDISHYQGYSTNTGPKGVLQDWRRYKQLQTEQKQEQEREMIELGKKLTLTCRTSKEDDLAAECDEDIERMFDEMEDDFLKQYRQRRIDEMRKAVEEIPKFGHVYELTKEEFCTAIDSERAQTMVIVHLYEPHVQACVSMHGCLACLAQEYPTVKFCRIRATEAKLSAKFSSTGVPALLIYKNKELISSFIRLSDNLGHDFFATDVEGFLLEHGLLPDKTLVPSHIAATNDQNDSGSDFEID